MPRAAKDGGTTLIQCAGIPAVTYNPRFWDNWNKPIVSDRKTGGRFYAFIAGTLYVSNDGGANFSVKAANLPVGVKRTLKASPYSEGVLWLGLEGEGLFHSTNAGETFSKTDFIKSAVCVSIGPPLAGNSAPIIYVLGHNFRDQWGCFASFDGGFNWIRLNDDANQLSCAPKIMEADRQTPGRVYIGSGGRGIYLGQIQLPSENAPPTASIVNIRNGQVLNDVSDVTILANAADIDGNISKVEFFAGDQKMDESTTAPYMFSWKRIPAGNHTIKVISTDNLGASTVSENISFITTNNTTGSIEKIQNGGFYDHSFWKIGNYGGNATFTVTNQEAAIKISDNGTEDWHVQLTQDLNLEKDANCIISFRARADAARSMQVVMQQNISPYRIYWSKMVNLTTTMQSFGPFPFYSSINSTNNSFKFFLGNNSNAVYIDDVSIKRASSINDVPDR